MTTIVEAIKKSEAFYEKFRKAYKTIPPFYRELGDEAALAYFRRISSKRSTAHWHSDFGGTRFWFWRIWEDEGGHLFDSKTQVPVCIPLWQKRGIARHVLRFYSFNKPKEATK